VSDLPQGLITVADLYREMAAMRADTGKMLERLAIIDTREQITASTMTDHESRLRSVERFRWQMIGAAGAVGAASGIISSLLTAKGH
jgi:hypothetical protein